MVAMGRETSKLAKGVRRQQNYMQAGSCKTKGCMLNSHERGREKGGRRERLGKGWCK